MAEPVAAQPLVPVEPARDVRRVAREVLRLSAAGLLPAGDAAALARALHRWQGGGSPAAAARGPGPSSRDRDLPDRLRAALPEDRRWRGGWRVVDVCGEGAQRPRHVVARSDVAPGGQVRVLAPGDWTLPDGTTRTPRRGDAVRVSAADTWLHVDSGRWFALREPWPPAGRTDDVVVTSWAARPVDLVPVVADVSALLARLDVGYLAAARVVPDPHDRADALVVRLAASDLAAHSEALVDLAWELGARLRPVVPRFTRPLAPGLSVSQGHEEVGWSRCSTVARAVVALPPAQRRTEAAVLAAVVDALRRDGVDPVHPERAPARPAVG